MKKKSLFLTSLAALLITACTPPIPPDVLASYAEQEVLCANGPVTVATSENTQSTIQAGIDLYLASCPESQVTIATEINGANIVVSDLTEAEPKICETPLIKTSLMAQSSTLAYFVEGLDGLVLTPNAVAGLVNGSIKKWNDPLIAETNLDIELPDTDVSFFAMELEHASDLAFIDWMKDLSGEDFVSNPAKKYDDYASLVADMQLTNGSFSLLPANIIFDNSLTYVNIRNEEEDNLFESLSFSSAVSQVKITEGETEIVAQLDKTVEAQVDSGQSTTSLPWYGISYYDFAQCTQDDSENSIRTFMRFLLRLDAQGQLETYGFFPLTESLRTKAASLIGAVLPTPSVDPSLITE